MLSNRNRDEKAYFVASNEWCYWRIINVTCSNWWLGVNCCPKKRRQANQLNARLLWLRQTLVSISAFGLGQERGGSLVADGEEREESSWASCNIHYWCFYHVHVNVSLAAKARLLGKWHWQSSMHGQWHGIIRSLLACCQDLRLAAKDPLNSFKKLMEKWKDS